MQEAEAKRLRETEKFLLCSRLSYNLRSRRSRVNRQNLAHFIGDAARLMRQKLKWLWKSSRSQQNAGGR
jgi:hypothetical protein